MMKDLLLLEGLLICLDSIPVMMTLIDRNENIERDHKQVASCIRMRGGVFLTLCIYMFLFFFNYLYLQMSHV